jgi:hypothetical protein
MRQSSRTAVLPGMIGVTGQQQGLAGLRLYPSNRREHFVVTRLMDAVSLLECQWD